MRGSSDRASAITHTEQDATAHRISADSRHSRR